MVDLTYRPLEPTDLPALTDIVSDLEVVRQLGSWPWPHDAEFTASRCRSHVGDGFVWGIIRVGRLVGTIGVTDGRMGYSLRRDHWGQGIMSKAAQDAVSHAFATPTRDAIHADFWADNAASARILTKLGFAAISTEVRHAKARDEPTVLHMLLLTRDRWQRLSNPR
jgi:RimJ/RimL family protein N-acetyltransferase